MYYYFIQDELYHHGVMGQKWGVRRYQNTDGTLTDQGKARRYKKELNRLEKDSVDYRHKQNKVLAKANSYRNKYEKNDERGNLDAANEYKALEKKYRNIVNDYQKKINDTESQLNRVIKDVLNDGYNVTVNDITRSPRGAGKRILAQAALNIAVNVPVQLLTAGRAPIVTSYVEPRYSSHSYKVKKSNSSRGKKIDNRRNAHAYSDSTAVVW